MTVYITMLITSVLFMFFYDKYFSKLSKKISITAGSFNVRFVNKMWVLLPVLPMAVVGGIRYGVGQDYFYTYVPVFEKILRNSSEEVWGDMGYTLLNKCVQLFTDDYAGIFIVTSFIFSCF